MEKILRSVGIHDGPFHADEVTACALLLLYGLIDRDKIVRSRLPERLKSCEYICDVGGIYDPAQKLFDHHQVNYKGPLSSAGMILAYLREEKIISREDWQLFHETLIKGVDDHDNGKSQTLPGVTTFSHVIANFSPISYETTPNELNSAFFKALEFTLAHLTRLVERHKYSVACRSAVKEKMQKYKTCLIFDTSIPWQESFFALDGENHSALFVVMPAGQHWKLRCIPPSYENRMKVRLPLPEEWAGLLENELKKVTKIEGAIFCHKGRFTSVWQTKKEALEALDLVLKKNGLTNHDHTI